MAPGVMNRETNGSRPPVCLWIVHPSRLLRECLTEVLSDGLLQAQSIDPACDPAAAKVPSPPDAVVLDLHLPRAQVLHWIETLKCCAPHCKVILLAHTAADEELVEYLAAGAWGCVADVGSIEELRSAIQRVLEGEMFCSSAVIQSVFRRLAEGRQGPAWSPPVESTSLTARELEVLRLVAQHMSNKEIARRLKISLYTVKNHVHNIVEKLCVGDRHQAVEYARQRQWLPAKVEPG